MKTISANDSREELIARIASLGENDIAVWGRMDVGQMVRHCILWDRVAQGKNVLKRSFAGRVFGRMALQEFIRDDSPLRRNIPSASGLVVTDVVGDLHAEKKRWIEGIKEYGYLPNVVVVHPFFGKMTKEQIGLLAYKHTDHHLRQFSR